MPNTWPSLWLNTQTTFFKSANPWPLFCLFSFLSNTNLQKNCRTFKRFCSTARPRKKKKRWSRIWSSIVGVEDENADTTCYKFAHLFCAAQVMSPFLTEFSRWMPSAWSASSAPGCWSSTTSLSRWWWHSSQLTITYGKLWPPQSSLSLCSCPFFRNQILQKHFLP